jgi:hypothetical protein
MALEQSVELMQLSAESRNGLTYHRAPTEKLTGLQLNHFGAFCKRSWRSNDWLWGRIDAAGWITYLLLQPKRLRQLQDLINAGDSREMSREQFLEGLVNQLEAIAIGARGENVLDQSQQAYLRRLWENDKPAILEELEFLKHRVPQARPLEDPGLQNPEHVPDPTSLPRTSIALARGLQYAILKEELPKLRDDMEIDVEQGAGGRGTLPWRVRYDREWDSEASVRRPEAPVALFRDSPLPRERLGDEVGTDLFTYAAATTAATGLKAGTIALPAVPPVLNAPLAAARGIGIVLYFLSRWMLHASKTAFAAVAGAIALGLLLVFSNNGWAKTIGTALVGASAIVILLKAWRRLRVKSSALFKTAVGVAAVAAMLLLLFLLLAPWLPGPAEDAPAKGIRAAGDWLVSHPTAYVAIVTLALLAVVGSIPLQRRTERRSTVRPLREALEARARRLQLDLDLFIDPSVTRHLAGHLASVQRAGEELLSAVHSHAGKHVRLQVTGRKSLFQLDAEHDGERIGELRLTFRRVGRRKLYQVTDTPLTNSLRRSSLRIPLTSDSSSRADTSIETAEPRAAQPQG